MYLVGCVFQKRYKIQKNCKFLITEISICTNRINFINFFLLFFNQIHFGDLNLPEKTSSSSSGISSGGSSVGAQKQSASEALEKFFPPRYMDLEVTNSDPSVLESYLIEKWASLRGKSVHDCVRIYLTCTRKWQFFGAQLFQVQVSISLLDNAPNYLVGCIIQKRSDM